MKKHYLFVMMCFLSLTMFAQQQENQTAKYVDLGLPSGTQWRESNERGYYSYEQAINRFGNKVPEQWQWQELISNCEWIWKDGGYKVIGKNGKSLFLPAQGMLDGGSYVHSDCGLYWSSTSRWYNGYDQIYRLGFSWNEIEIGMSVDSGYQRSVRLVKN